MPNLQWRSLRLLSALAIACFLSVQAQAQVLYGSITGNVTDASKAAVPNANVTVVNVNTGASKNTTTNSEGAFLVSELQQGSYKVTVSGTAFADAIVDNVPVEPNQTRRVDAILQVSTVSQSVVVSGSAEALQTDRADVTTNITSRQLANLPITGSTGRNFQSLLTIVPGTSLQGEQNSAAANPQRAISFNQNGVSRLQNNTTIDGSSVTYPWLPTNIAYIPAAEAIDTVNVVTNAFNAEQGLAGGAVVNVSIKSGTNQYHGSGWIFNTDSHFKARNFFQTTPQNPKDILNQFGLTFGGPVWIPKVYNGKNKLFFFVDWERTTRRQSSPVRFYNLPTPALRNGDFTDPSVNTTIFDPASNADPRLRTAFANNRIPANRIDPGAAALVALIPQLNVGGLSGSNQYVSNFVANGVGTTDRDAIDIKVNQHLSDKATYFGRYSYSPSTIFDPPALGGAGGDALNGGQQGNATGLVQIAGAGLTYVFNPNLFMDANAGYTRQRLGAQNIDINQNFGLDVMKIPGTNGPDPLQGGIPFFAVSGWANLGNSGTGSPFLFRDNQYVASTNLSWVRQSHTIRVGWNYQNQQLNHFQAQGGTFQTVRGSFQFSGQSTALQNGSQIANRFNSWADFLLGDASAAGKSAQRVNPNTLRLHAYAAYIQDQWQVNQKLTVNYGLRWEWYPFPRTDHGGVARFDPATGNVYAGGFGNVPNDTYADSGVGEFLPRIGVAYRATEKTVVRSGFGLSADPRPFIDFRNAYPNINNWQMPQINNNPFLPVTTFRSGLNEAAYGQFPDLSSGVVKLPANSGTTTFPKSASRKYIESFNFLIQHQFGSDLTAQAGYVGTRAVGQMGFININSAPPGGGNAGRALASSLGLLSDINDVMPFKTTTYDSLQTQLTRRWGGSVAGMVYTWSKAINWADNDANPRIQYPGAWYLNRGPAGYDRTHNFQTFFTVQSPFGKNRRWVHSGVGSMLLGGWELNGILGAESGQPIYVIQNTGNNLNAAGSSQVPDLLNSTVATLGGIGVGHPYFDTTAFRQINIPAGQPQRFGNSGRDNIRGPGLLSFDSGIARSFPIREIFHIQFRVDALNVLNHANFSNPSNNISDPTTFGYITSTALGERQFRFAARVFF